MWNTLLRVYLAFSTTSSLSLETVLQNRPAVKPASQQYIAPLSLAQQSLATPLTRTAQLVMMTGFKMLVESVGEELYSGGCSDRKDGAERSEVVSVEGLNTRISRSPTEIVLRIVDFMCFVDFLNLRHASAWFFRFSTTWEAPFVASFSRSYNMGVADRLFRTLAPEGQVKLDYFVRLWRRCITAEKLANYSINYPMPESNLDKRFQYFWFWDSTKWRFIPPSNINKLERCLLLHNHFFESLHTGLANHFAVEMMETQPQQETPAFLKVEATVLSRYTPDAINRLVGVHEWLFTIIASKSENTPLLALSNQHEKYIFDALGIDPFLFGGQLDLGTAKRISSILPTGYIRNLGFGWGPIVDRDNAIAQFADYVMSAVDDEDDMLVQDTSTNHSDANASPEASPCVTSEYPPTSTATIPIAGYTRSIRRPKRLCALKGVGRS